MVLNKVFKRTALTLWTNEGFNGIRSDLCDRVLFFGEGI